MVDRLEPGSPPEANQGTCAAARRTCPCCRYTTPVASVRHPAQGSPGRRGRCEASVRGYDTAQATGRFYRLPTEDDLEACSRGGRGTSATEEHHRDRMTSAERKDLPQNEIRRISAPIYGMTTWGDLFSPRQALALVTLTALVREAVSGAARSATRGWPKRWRRVWRWQSTSRRDLTNSLCAWEPFAECPRHLFGRQAIPIVWDFAEGVPVSDSSGGWSIFVDNMARALESVGSDWRVGTPSSPPPRAHPLPDDAAHAFVTDPPITTPYRDAYLSELLLRPGYGRTLGSTFPALITGESVPKDEEIVVDRQHELSTSTKDIAFYEANLQRGVRGWPPSAHARGHRNNRFRQARRRLLGGDPPGDGRPGWVITASWPIDTEMASKVAAIGQARLMSSVTSSAARERTPTARCGRTPSATGGQCCASCPSASTPDARLSREGCRRRRDLRLPRPRARDLLPLLPRRKGLG